MRSSDLSISILPAQDQPTPNPHWAFAGSQAAKNPTPPAVMHLCVAGCSTGRGGTLVWENGRYADRLAPGSVYTIETFTPDLVVLGWSITGEHGPADAGGAREVPKSEQPQD
jgi:hypothetical protein